MDGHLAIRLLDFVDGVLRAMQHSATEERLGAVARELFMPLLRLCATSAMPMRVREKAASVLIRRLPHGDLALRREGGWRSVVESALGALPQRALMDNCLRGLDKSSPPPFLKRVAELVCVALQQSKTFTGAALDAIAAKRPGAPLGDESRLGLAYLEAPPGNRWARPIGSSWWMELALRKELPSERQHCVFQLHTLLSDWFSYSEKPEGAELRGLTLALKAQAPSLASRRQALHCLVRVPWLLRFFMDWVQGVNMIESAHPLKDLQDRHGHRKSKGNCTIFGATELMVVMDRRTKLPPGWTLRIKGIRARARTAPRTAASCNAAGSAARTC